MNRLKKEDVERFLNKERKAGDPENYETSWNEEGLPVSKKKSEIKKGRASRARGARFELKVRRDLEEKGRTVDKWGNNVEMDENEGKLIIAKRKYNPVTKFMAIGTGFPDFIALKKVHEGLYSAIGVEVKINGILSKEEKEKCRWYLEKGIFSDIWIAKEKKDGRKSEVEYVDFKERYIR